MGKGSRGGSGSHSSSHHGSSHSSSSSHGSSYRSNTIIYGSGGYNRSNWSGSSSDCNCSCSQCLGCLFFITLVVFTIITVTAFSSTDERVIMDPGETRQLKLNTWSYGSGYIMDSTFSVTAYSSYERFKLTASDTSTVDKSFSISVNSYEYLVYYLNYGSSFELDVRCNEGVWLIIFDSDSDFDKWESNIDSDVYAAKKWVKGSEITTTRFSQIISGGGEVYLVLSNEASSTTTTVNAAVNLSLTRTLYSTDGLEPIPREFSLNSNNGATMYLLLAASSDTSSESYQVSVHLQQNKENLSKTLFIGYGIAIGLWICVKLLLNFFNKKTSDQSYTPISVTSDSTNTSSSTGLIQSTPVYATAVVDNSSSVNFPSASAPPAKEYKTGYV